jgi:chromosome segregation ATPase
LFLIEPYQRPNEEERQVFLARQEAVRVEYDALQKTVTENEHVYAEQASSLERSQQIIAEMEGTISRLEQELAEQRNTFRERLLEYRTEAERYVTTVKTEVEDAGRAARNVSPVKEHDVDLEQVSQRLQMLNMSKASLTQELEDARESVKLTERRNRQLRARVSELEAQQKESEDKLNQTQRTRSVRDHTFQLKGKYTALKTKYQELETQYTQLRHSRLSRFDPLMQQRQMSPRRDNELDELNAQKARISETRIEVLRGRVEEMQVLLEKATGTIERLNQLVSRKETQLTHFHQQIAELKQELASRS